MADDRIIATYETESPLPMEKAADILADQLTTSTFVDVPGETESLRSRFRARVERVDSLDFAPAPNLPGVRLPPETTMPARYQRARITISFSLEIVGVNLPTLISIVAGDVSALSQFSGARLVDLELPVAFASAYPGPQFGIAGTRRLTGVFDRPVIGAVVKPSIGLTPRQTAELVGVLSEAGVDFIKDNEKMANPPHSPLEERVAEVMRVINRHANRTGRKVMYAFNITDDIESMLRHHDAVLKSGGTCVMVSVYSVGLAGVSYLRTRCQLPIHAHRTGWSFFTRYPHLGIDFTVWQKLWRLAGVDQLHVNGLQNKFWEPDDSVVRSIQACHTPLFGGYRIMPVVASGQWGGQAPETFKRTGTIDLMYVAGGGIIGHPGGPAAGVLGLRQAWEAAMAGIQLDDYAQTHPELRQTLEKFHRRAPKV